MLDSWDARQAATLAGYHEDSAEERAAELLADGEVRRVLRALALARPLDAGAVAYLERDLLWDLATPPQVRGALLERAAKRLGLDDGRFRPLDTAGIARDLAELTRAGMGPLDSPALDREGIPPPPAGEVVELARLMTAGDEEALEVDPLALAQASAAQLDEEERADAEADVDRRDPLTILTASHNGPIQPAPGTTIAGGALPTYPPREAVAAGLGGPRSPPEAAPLRPLAALRARVRAAEDPRREGAGARALRSSPMDVAPSGRQAGGGGGEPGATDAGGGADGRRDIDVAAFFGLDDGDPDDGG